MAVGTNTTADIDNAVRPFLAESRYVLEHVPVMKGLVRNERMPSGQGGDYRYPKYSTLPDAQDLTQGIDITQSQKISDTLATITPTEVGLKIVMTKRLIKTVRDDMMRLAGKLMGESLARKLDKDGLTMLDGFSIPLGSAGTALTWEYIAAAESAIMGGSEPAPASSPIYGVFHPHQLHPLAKDFAPAGTYPIPSGISNDIVTKGLTHKTIAGVPLFRDGNLSKDSSDDAKGGVFSKEAIILVLDDMPGIEKDYRASLRGYEIVQSWWYAYGEYLDAWGREMVFDAVTPTS